MDEINAVVNVSQTGALALPDEQQFRRDIQAINRFQSIVHENLVKDQDYGVIPGTQKPTLLKPGAEKIAKLLGLSDTYEIVDKQENWDKPFFRYIVRANLATVGTGYIVSAGMGECNSMEAKYRWRDASKKCPKCGQPAIIKGKDQYGGGWICFAKKGGCGAKFLDGDHAIESQPSGRVENDDIYSLVNTILKMAKKRALVDAALSAGRLSNVFTQDIEDIKAAEFIEIKPSRPSTMTRESLKHLSDDELLAEFERQTDEMEAELRASQPAGQATTEKPPVARPVASASAKQSQSMTRGDMLNELWAKLKARGVTDTAWLADHGYQARAITGLKDAELAEALARISSEPGQPKLGV